LMQFRSPAGATGLVVAVGISSLKAGATYRSQFSV
jgi:hypothetical protein